MLVCSVSYLFILIADIDAIKDVEPIEVPGRPEVNQPFSLPCFHDVDNQLFPRDAAKFTSNIAFNWELAVAGKRAAAFPEDVATDPTRIKIHPLTGEIQALNHC